MSLITKELEIHETNIKEKYDKLEEEKDSKDKSHIKEKIISEQQFIISLLKIEDNDKKSENKSVKEKLGTKKEKKI